MKKLFSLLLILSLIVCSVAGLSSCLLPTPATPEGGGDEIEEEKKDDTDDSVWQKGYVGSRQNTEYSEKIKSPDDEYIYTDVIELGAKGTRVSFTDSQKLSDISDVYVLSFWEKVGDEWELDSYAPNQNDESSVVRTVENGVMTYSYVSSRDGECIRFCYRVGTTFYGEYPRISTEQTSETGTLATEFERMEYLEMDTQRAYYDVLEGKTAYFIGDSLFGAHGIGKENCWIALLGDKYKMNYVNYGISGCTLSACEGGANPIINRYTEMSKEQPDFIVIEGGRNDFNKGALIGSIDEKDKTTYLGALSMLVEGLRERYPDATIIAVTFWKTNTTNKTTGKSSNEYVDAMMAACDELGVLCVNAYDNTDCPVDMTDADFRAQYCFEPGDVCHLNVDGMKLVMPFFEKEIAEILGK